MVISINVLEGSSITYMMSTLLLVSLRITEYRIHYEKERIYFNPCGVKSFGLYELQDGYSTR